MFTSTPLWGCPRVESKRVDTNQVDQTLTLEVCLLLQIQCKFLPDKTHISVSLEQGFVDFMMHTDHLGILLNCRSD